MVPSTDQEYVEEYEQALFNRKNKQTDIELFPGGWPGSTLDVEKPLARIELSEDTTIERDLLFDQILERETNRRAFRDRPLAPEQISELFEACEGVYVSTGYITDSSICEKLADFAVKAMEIEISGEDRIAETLRYFRFNDEEIDLRQPLRDGASPEKLKQVITEAIQSKPKKHHLPEGRISKKRHMSQVGG